MIDIIGRTFTCAELAEILGVTERTLYAWRQSGKGPEFLTLGGAYRYPINTLQKWIEKNRRTIDKARARVEKR